METDYTRKYLINELEVIHQSYQDLEDDARDMRQYVGEILRNIELEAEVFRLKAAEAEEKS